MYSWVNLNFKGVWIVNFPTPADPGKIITAIYFYIELWLNIWFVFCHTFSAKQNHFKMDNNVGNGYLSKVDHADLCSGFWFSFDRQPAVSNASFGFTYKSMFYVFSRTVD